MNIKNYAFCSVFFLVGVAVFLNAFRIHSTHQIEDELVDFIIAQARLNGDAKKDAEELTRAIGLFTEPRRAFSDSTGFEKNSRQSIARSPIITFIAYGGGACGFSSEVGARVFEKSGFDTRFVQVQNQRERTHHVVFDVRKGDFGPCVVDPIFGHIFLDEHGHGLSAEELKRNWAEVQPSLPDGNRLSEYSYEYGVQFTNWSRFGSLEAPIKAMLSLFVADLESISLRSWYNRFMRVFPGLSFMLSLALIWLGSKAWAKTRKA